MNLVAWQRVIVLAGLTAALMPRAVSGQEIQPVSADDRARQDLQRLSELLSNPTTKRPQRDEAARRLVQRQSEASRAIVQDLLLGTSNRDTKVSLLKALAADPHPDEGLIAPLGAMLSDRSLTEATAEALASYDDNVQALSQVAGFARDQKQPTAGRVAAIRAIGELPQKASADVLIELLTRRDESAVVRNAAADALIDLTGLRENGRSVKRWRQWHQANAEKPEVEWRADLLRSRAAADDELKQRHNALLAELEVILIKQYRAAPEQERANVVLGYLNSSEQDIRAIGARIVAQAFSGAEKISDATKDRLVELVGDSGTNVRLEVARTLRTINHAKAIDALLAQLAQEREASVKIALAEALERIEDLRSIPQLRRLLDDESFTVAEAGASAIHQLAPTLREKQPELAAQVAVQLRGLINRYNNVPAAQGLRAACIEALAPLRDPASLNEMPRFLNAQEPVRVRQAALEALGELGDQRAADRIVDWIFDEPNPDARRVAVEALGKAGAGPHTTTIWRLMRAAEEPDPAVRDAAWQVFQNLLPQASNEQLMNWAQRFKDDPARRIFILKSLAQKLEASKNLADWALQQQNIGADYMSIDQPEQAAPYFRAALQYWALQHNAESVTERLIEQLLDALLRSKQYAEAARFGAESLKAASGAGGANPLQQTIGSKIKNAADSLRNNNDFAAAMLLIDEAIKMNPPLNDLYLEDLQNIRRDIEQKQRQPGTPRGP